MWLSCSGAVRSVVKQQVGSICVLPNEIVVPLTTETDVVKLYFPEPDVQQITRYI